MVYAPEADAAVTRRDEISGLARQADVTRAIKRLLDYSRDFSTVKTFEYEAVVLSSQFNRLRESQRKGLRSETDVETELNRIVVHILERTDQVYEQFADGTESRRLQAPLNPAAASAMSPPGASPEPLPNVSSPRNLGIRKLLTVLG